MKSNYKRLGDYIHKVDERNKAYNTNLQGLSMTKEYRSSTSNIVGTDLSSYKIMRKNRFVCDFMSVIRVYKLPVVLHKSDEIAIVSPAYTTFEVNDISTLLPEYLMLWFRRSEFDRYAFFKCDSAIRGGFDWEALCDCLLPIPDIDEQRRIVNAYNTIERRIELKRNINENLLSQAYTVYRDWFIDNGEAHGATECVLADLMNIFDYKRIPLSSQERASKTKIYRYFGAAGLLDYVDDYLFDGVYLLVGEDGSVIDENGFPYLQYIDGKFWVNNHAHILQGNGNITTELLYLILLKANIKEYVTGAVQAKLNQDNLRAIPAICISKDEMPSFNAIIQPIFASIRQNSVEIDRMQTLKASILSKLAQSN